MPVGGRDIGGTQAWREMFSENGVENVFEKELNTGFLVLKGGLHKEIKDDFGEFLAQDLHREEFANDFNAHDQYAFALALGEYGLSLDSDEVELMDESEHYWGPFPEEDTVVYHGTWKNRREKVMKKISRFLGSYQNLFKFPS